MCIRDSNGTSGEIEAGEFIDVTLVVEVDPDSPTVILNPNDELLNQALGGGDDDAGNSVDDFSDDPTDATDNDLNGDGNPDDPTGIVIATPTADLVTVKTLASGDATPDEGDTVTFDITITNSGPSGATSVSLTDLLPAGLTPTAANGTTTQGSYDPVTGLFTVGNLASGATATLTLEGTVDAGQGGNTITNVTTAATGDQPDQSTVGDDLDEAVIVNETANLVTVKTLLGGDATPDEGDTVTFQIEVTNNGAGNATGVSLLTSCRLD